jgi:hypothetical protein
MDHYLRTVFFIYNKNKKLTPSTLVHIMTRLCSRVFVLQHFIGIILYMGCSIQNSVAQCASTSRSPDNYWTPIRKNLMEVCKPG